MVGSAPSSSLVERSSLLDAAGFRHGFSVGDGSAPALDFALARDPAGVSTLAVALERLGAELAFATGRLYQVKQVHGTTTHLAEGDPRAVVMREGDAVVAREAGAVAGIRVADCVPILVADEASGACAAIHAGWRGVERGVVSVALDVLGGSKRTAAIGPCIGACCFEVSVEVAELLARAVADEGVVVSRYGEGKAKVDLRRAVRAQLVAKGIPSDRIEDVGGCSVCHPEKYHSFRRDGEASGRMLAVIVARGSAPESLK